MAGFPANATLTFEVSSGEQEIDENGVTRVVTETLTVKAFLNEASSNTSSSVDDYEPIGERHSLFMEGRCLDPKSLPPSLGVGSEAKAVIGGQVGKITGTFSLAAVAQSPFEKVPKALGQKIRGELVVSSQYVGQG
ncbi:MAG: hypothetical protein F6K00_19630 [Leptolyngbya sp. SIOISBB]|nr:hypothetical protein [Leptolyngbya sp. SIOISBB]